MKTIPKLIVIIICIGVTFPLLGQLKRRGLIISEVYLDSEQPQRSWIEIFNPNDSTAMLNKLRYYHIKTLNMLSKEIMDSGGISISPKECIVICANEELLTNKSLSGSKLFEIRILAAFGKGGYLTIATKDMGDEGRDAFRYGNPAVTSKHQELIGDFLVPFSSDSKSYRRVYKNGYTSYFVKEKQSPFVFDEEASYYE